MLNLIKRIPDQNLNNEVESFYILENNSSLNLPTEAYRNHPQGTVDIMFAIEGGIYFTSKKDQEVSLDRIFMIAQQEGMFDISFKPNSRIIGVVLYPECFRKLFNFPIAEISNNGERLYDFLGSTYRDCYEKLAEAKDDEHIFKLMSDLFQSELTNGDQFESHFDKMVAHIRKTNGNVSIESIANMSNLSIRTLQRKMNTHVGISAKSYSNVVRFRHAVTLIRNHPEMNWQDILFICGYFDQAHFIKEFRKYTGNSPSQFVKTDHPLAKFFVDNPPDLSE